MDAQAPGALKHNAGQEIDRISDRLWEIALLIHSHPEGGWETPQAVRWLTESLEEEEMGNVGEVCPAIHPYVKISDESTSTHSRAFAEAAKAPAGRKGMLQAAKALAMTALDLFYDESLLPGVKEDFLRYRAETEGLS